MGFSWTEHPEPCWLVVGRIFLDEMILPSGLAHDREKCCSFGPLRRLVVRLYLSEAGWLVLPERIFAQDMRA